MPKMCKVSLLALQMHSYISNRSFCSIIRTALQTTGSCCCVAAHSMNLAALGKYLQPSNRTACTFITMETILVLLDSILIFLSVLTKTFLSSSLLSRNLKIKIYRTKLLPAVCMDMKLGR